MVRADSRLQEIQGPFLTLETTSIIDIIFLINALGEIQRWGDNEYRLWFMGVIDGIVSSSAARGNDDASDNTDDKDAD